MATNQPEHVTVLGIGGRSDHSVYYYFRHDDVVPAGRDRDSFIKELISSGELFRRDNDDGHEHGHGHRHLPGGGHTDRGPERSLDITETRQNGSCTYIFALDADVGESELTFVQGKPFIFLPLNDDRPADWPSELEAEDFGNGRLARFTCNLGNLYDSPLAELIREMAKRGHGHPFAPVLNIPFCLNVRDSKLQASPWVVPRHHHGPILTHGGVHPPEVSFIGMEL